MDVSRGSSLSHSCWGWGGFKQRSANSYSGYPAPIIITVSILVRKLKFLTKLLAKTSDANSCRIFHTLAARGNIFDIGLVQQCKELELLFGTNLLVQCIDSPDEAMDIVQNRGQDLLEADWDRTIAKAANHPSLTHVSCPMLRDEWTTLWDRALDHGTLGTTVSQAIFGLLCRPVYGDRICPYCSDAIPGSDTFVQHLSSSHDFEYKAIIASLLTNKDALFNLPLCRHILRLRI